MNWRSQKGFTFIEFIVAMALTGLIGVAASAAAYQVINVKALSENHIIAVKQVENAAYWINLDVRMSQTVLPAGGGGFPLNLSWIEWDNTTHDVRYTISNGELQRSSSINGAEPTQMMVANYIDGNADQTNCQYANGVFTFKVTASVAGFRPATETRMGEALPRSAQ